MKWIRRYNESVTIKATDDTIYEIVHGEIRKLGDNCDLNHIDVSEVTETRGLFFCRPFNVDISRWDVGNVTNMYNMFAHSQFNRDISQWNVGNVRIFSHSKFGGDLSNWNVQNVTDMNYMFYQSPLEGREPWWYILSDKFIDNESMYQSIEVYEWIDTKRKIIWKKRLNYAFQDFGKVGSQIPQSIWGFTIQ